jgi:hypothetical protein
MWPQYPRQFPEHRLGIAPQVVITPKRRDVFDLISIEQSMFQE